MQKLVVNTTIKNNIIMVIKLTENQSREPLYVTPAIKSLDIMSEGLLCGSFDTANFGYEENNLGEI